GALAGTGGALVSALGQGVATGPVMVLAAVSLTALSLLLAPERGLVARWLRQLAARRSLRGRQVLAALGGMEHDHADPHYAGDARMLQAYLGADAGPALARLHRDGFIRPAAARAPEGSDRRWELTASGRERLEREGQGEGGGDA
ncbi:MAG: hypothetical protein ACK4GT_20835, partial [Pararhodobacter sp.]